MQRAKTSKLIISMFVLIAALFFVNKAEAFPYEDRISTSKSMAHYAMGQVYDLLGETERAVLEYEKAVFYDEASYLIHLRLGTDYARLNMLNEAVEELKLVYHHNPEDLQSHYLLALIYSTRQEFDLAAEEYEFILKTFSENEPENIEIYGYLGQLYYSQRKYDKAIIQFERILEIEPKNADVMYLLGSLYLEVNKEDRAIELFERSIDIDPDHDGSLNTLGYIYAENGDDLEEAERLIRRALMVSPDNGAYLDSLGWVYYQKGEYEEAIATFEKADLVLKDPVVYEHMGDAYFKLSEFDQAIKYWELSLKLLPDQENVIRKLNEVKSIQVSM